MPSELHEKLCDKGLSWLKRNGFSVAATNIWASGSRERVDCIGYRETCSAMIEAKVSRSDFYADKKKPERIEGGVGVYRFYITPKGLLSLQDIPYGWGLLEVHGRSVRMIYGPKGNHWPNFGKAQDSDWKEFANEPDESAERAILFSIARRALS